MLDLNLSDLTDEDLDFQLLVLLRFRVGLYEREASEADLEMINNFVGLVQAEVHSRRNS